MNFPPRLRVLRLERPRVLQEQSEEGYPVELMIDLLQVPRDFRINRLVVLAHAVVPRRHYNKCWKHDNHGDGKVGKRLHGFHQHHA